MKINTLTLKSYGKFKEKKIEFKDGLNVIYGTNGSGKSTVSTALKGFLYKDIRGGGKYKKTYIPIGEQRGAYDVSFSTDDGEKYESFITAGLTSGKTISKTVKLSDNRDVAADSENGEFFFGASEEFYDSVCYIKDHADFRKVSENSISVNEKLSASAVAERSSSDVSEAISLLGKELLMFSRKTSSGLIYPKECELQEINKSLMQMNELCEEEKRLELSEESIKNLALEKQKERKRLMDLRAEHEKYEKYRSGFSADEKREEELLIRLKELEYEPEVLTDEEEEILKEISPGKLRSIIPWMLLLFCGILFGVLSAVESFFMIPFAVILPVSLAGLISALINNRKVKQADTELATRKKELLKSVSCNSTEEYEEKLKKIREDRAELKIIKRELERIKSLSSVKNAYTFLKKPEGDYAETVNKLEKINEDISELRISFNSLSERRKSLFNNLPSRNELAERKEELEKEIENLRAGEEITLAAKEALERTREVYKNSYIPFVSERAEEILCEVEKNLVDKLILDEKFSPSLREKNDTRIKAEEYLSSGVSDSVYFAVRLAVCEFAFKDNESPVLILDDPFVRMDDERAEAWMRYLSGKKDFQMIFFTAGERFFKLGLENTTSLGL